ncbi:ABC transporter ATP-binding protein [Embleya sp. NBC_00896]|uniref:ABC transporter ATP-binding protein n=1 Tax=Embleya sp. NBC_00896 TaxID=2975961 RepID=UPI002F90851D|nr:ABC transporter ATP-binding protein/permease [Embleya sp. NBC_00896]
MSESERVLFGGALRWDLSFTAHEQPLLRMSFRAMARQLPSMAVVVTRAAWAVDRAAVSALLLAEIGQGLAGGLGLLATNRALVALFADVPTADRLRQAAPALVFIMVVTAVSALLAAVSVGATSRLEPQVERVCTARYYRAAARVELQAFEEAEFHRTLDAGRFGTDSVRRMLGASVAVVNALVGLVATGSVLTLLHPILLPLLILVAAPKGWGAVRSARRQHESAHAWLEHRRAIEILGRSLIEPAPAAEVRAHRAGRLVLDAFDDMSTTMEAEQRRLAHAKGATQAAASALSGVGALLVYAALWLLLTAGGMPLAAGGTAVIAIRTCTSGLTALVMQVNRLYEESLYLRDLENACTESERRAIPTGGQPLPHDVDEVRLDDVSYTYPGNDNPALDKVTLRIPAGKVIALVGENGSGKTTLSKLVAGLLLPSEGRLTWAGVDLCDADRDQVFERVAVLGQDFPRWAMTARANVFIGRPDRPIDQARVEAAVERADAGDLVASLPHGWDTLIVKGYQRGSQISGGQWQKIGNARTRYRGAPFVIVDEPTSALDPEAEIAAFAALRSMTDDGTTVLLITHRLAATATADLIYVLERGRLIEQGDHASLMTLDQGRYRGMYTAQAAQYGVRAAVVPPARTAGVES